MRLRKEITGIEVCYVFVWHDMTRSCAFCVRLRTTLLGPNQGEGQRQGQNQSQNLSRGGRDGHHGSNNALRNLSAFAQTREPMRGAFYGGQGQGTGGDEDDEIMSLIMLLNAVDAMGPEALGGLAANLGLGSGNQQPNAVASSSSSSSAQPTAAININTDAGRLEALCVLYRCA
jgi:hypothetical protein